MNVKKTISRIPKILSVIMTLAVFLSVFGARGFSPAAAQENAAGIIPAFTLSSSHVLSDGQFVYGPNIGSFNLKNYLDANAPHLSKYADDLYGRSEYYSINPKVYLTLLEIHSHLISIPDSVRMEDPFGLKDGGLISQIDVVSEKMSDAYYLHLYTYSSLPVSQRSLPAFTVSGGMVNAAPETNAGTYAIMAGLAAIDQKNISLMLDNSQPNGFYQTYNRLFANDDPLNEKNHIIPGEAGALSAPANLLQLPYLQGLSWRFGGVHNTSGGNTLTDASALDFYPGGSAWGMDTSNMWVVAAASGIPTRFSDCGYKISHSGALNAGWETTYYHLEGAKYLSGSINQNDKIGVIANTLAEATCTGGASSGPHVHFSLKYNGAFVAIDGTPLSGWYVHGGRFSYDVDPNYMWLERAGIKKYAYGDVVLSEGSPTSTYTINGSTGLAGTAVTYTGGSITADGSGNYSITVPLGWMGTVTPSSPCYTYTPQSRSYTNISINMLAQNYTPAVTDPACAAGDISLRDSGDYNGDGKTDLAVFRPSTGMWIVKDWTTNTEMFRMAWGGGADKPVPGDYNGDGKTDLAVFRVGSLQWIVKDWSTNTEILRMSWGGLTDKPVPGDYNGDGKTDLAVYRPSTGMWIVKDWATNTEMFRMAWGGPLDKPVPADYNGDGRTDIAVFRASSLQWIVKDWATNTEILRMSWGGMTDIPVPGDYNGDGKADLAVYRPSTGMWIVKDWTTNTEIFRMAWGGGADKLVPGDYNGDLKTDIGVFRASSLQWIVKDWATNTEILRMPWGGMTDIPLSR